MGLPRIIFGPSTAADWTSRTCIEDTASIGTFPRTVLASFAVATSSNLTVSGQTLSITDTTSVGKQGTRYICQ